MYRVKHKVGADEWKYTESFNYSTDAWRAFDNTPAPRGFPRQLQQWVAGEWVDVSDPKMPARPAVSSTVPSEQQLNEAKLFDTPAKIAQLIVAKDLWHSRALAAERWTTAPWGSIPPAHRFGQRLTEDAVVHHLLPGSLLRFYSGDPWFEKGESGPRNGQIVVFTGKISNDFPQIGLHIEVAGIGGHVYPGGGWVYHLFQFISDCPTAEEMHQD